MHAPGIVQPNSLQRCRTEALVRTKPPGTAGVTGGIILQMPAKQPTVDMALQAGIETKLPAQDFIVSNDHARTPFFCLPLYAPDVCQGVLKLFSGGPEYRTFRHFVKPILAPRMARNHVARFLHPRTALSAFNH